jgi:predicted nucleotidyltransferase
MSVCMKQKIIFKDLAEDLATDIRIVKTFKPKDTLSTEVFEKRDGGFVMIDEVRNSLIEIADKFLNFIGIEFFVHDVRLTGSLANYNWSKYSDVDLHILIDFKETDYDLSLIKEFFDAKKNNWNHQHTITVKGYDVELYVQDTDEEHQSTGVYSVLNNEWVVEPNKVAPKIDEKKIIEKGTAYAEEIESIVSDHKDGKDVNTRIDKVKAKLKSFRQGGLARGGEFSYENLTFKLLRRNGYIEKLLDLNTDVTDRGLSITQ